ncbi:hypothetical protein [Caecibacteroides pullorum]|uniref:Uncharacterized protein n=1 Tax=Caecibacteroides pullorum TaxID=2725562 RepID=A0AA40ZSY8_9BACT|nr:hypothetical protein [Caecibacteroides pullorum]MBM6857037.1 hypothetical protein [Caecibacteroides pullorum]MBV8058042.1 hypothetical protein [Caecibacteroides pullorum]
MATYYGRKYRLLEFRHFFKELLLTIKIALKSKELNKPQAQSPIYIAMIDGQSFHGGMCDRFKGIISLYAYCKYHDIPFRIRYTYPFKLEDYLLPATYDWILKKNEYTDNPKYCRVLYMRGEHLAKRLLKLKTNKQVHYYSNRDCLEHINNAYTNGNKNRRKFRWGELFCELFHPGPVLEERILSIKKELGDNYYAAVFRFQNLLGDFQEYHFKSLNNKDEVEKLIEKCLDSIKNLKAMHKDKALLVTSDSITFLKKAVQIEGVHIIPGTLIHMDGQKNNIPQNSYEIYLKSFIDFYMLSEAQKIYRIGTPYMYPSEFPVYAAKIHNIPFESITI